MKLDYFRKESQCFLRVITAEVLHLSKNLLIIIGEKLVEEKRRVVSVGLTEIG